MVADSELDAQLRNNTELGKQIKSDVTHVGTKIQGYKDIRVQRYNPPPPPKKKKTPKNTTQQQVCNDSICQ